MRSSWLAACTSASELRADRSAPLLTASRDRETALVDRDAHRLGRDAVCYDYQRTRSRLHPSGNIEVCRNGSVAGGDAHGAVVMCLGVENVTASLICDAYQGIVGRGFVLVPKCSRL